MKRAISYLFALLAFASLGSGINNAMAQVEELKFTTGEKLSHFLSVCLAKEDAIEILNAHKNSGREAAERVWQAKDGCMNGNVVGPTVGKVVYSVRAEGGKVVSSAVEIIYEGKVVGYFITTSPVNKPQRNS